MKQTKFLFSVLMAIVMMAMSPTKVWADNVASVTINGTTTEYANVKDAVADAVEATEATVTLLANSDLLGDYITFGKGNVTLDLNGKTLAAQSNYVTYVNGGSLTITDNSEGTPGRIECASGPVTINSGSLTIHAGTFSSLYGGAALSIVSSTGVAVSIDGGRYITSHEYASAISTNGVSLLAPGYAYYITGTETQIVANNLSNSSYKDVTVREAGESPEVTDAVSVTIGETTTGYADFDTALTAAEVASSATIKLLQNVDISSITTFDQGNITLDLNGKTFQNQNGSAMAVNGASLTIIDSSEEQTGKVQSSGGMYSTTISAYSGSLTIYAGTFDSSSMAALSVSKAGSDVLPNVKLYGGHFISPSYAIYTEDPNILASGKAFYDMDDNILTEIAEYGYLLGTDGYSAQDVTVKTVPNYVASITINGTTTGYNNIQDAFSAALDADAATMKMLADVEINSSLNVDKGNVTLDLNGKTITSTASSESPALYLTTGSFSITDSSNDKKGEIKKNSPNLLKVTGGKLTISEGTFTANFFVLDISGEGTASLSGGKFISIGGGPAINNTSGKSILAEGYGFYSTTNAALTEKTDNYIMAGPSPATQIIVKPATVIAEVTIGSVITQHTIFQSALDDALDAESATIKMLADVAISSTLVVNKENCNVTLDLNGHKIATQYANTLNLSNGELTIKDSSGDDSGTMSTSGSYALNVTGGILTIHGGTFSASEYALNITSPTVTATIDGGIFKATGGSGINNKSGKSILANGYAFCNSEGDELLEIKDDYIREGNFPVHYIIVKKATPKATLTINGETTDYFDFMTAYNVAINSTNPVTMKLLADANLTDINSGNSLEMTKGNVTIDLNSHKIYFSAYGRHVLVLNGGSLTIDDSSEDKTGTIETNANSVLFHVDGTLTIHEGKFVSTDSYALDTFGSPNRVISIYGGRFIGASTAIYSNKDVLPDGYSYFNAENGMKLSTKSSTYENGQNVSEVIVRANATVINDGAFTCPVSYTPESVTFNRTITKDGGKYSFIVPFDIPADKAATFGKFYTYDKYENEIVYFAEETEGVRANTAYFFAPATTIASISLNKAEIKATTSMADAANPSEFGLYGTYKRIAVPDGAYGYASSAEGDKFVRAGTGSYVNAFRCYLWLGNSDSAPAKANAIFGFDEATGINATKADYLDLNAPMYNLRGQRVTSPQKGEIYIMDGKKVMFK